VIAWNPLPDIAYYEFYLNTAQGQEIVADTVPAPEGGLIVTYTINIETLGEHGAGWYVWEVRPIGQSGALVCGNLSGEFSYTP
jgi:hypothetical protein